MVAAIEYTKTYPKDDKIPALTTFMYNLEENKTSILATVQGGGGNRNQTRTNNEGRDSKKSYVEGINNLESWRVKKSKENITRNG